MPRPVKYRKIERLPRYTYFVPVGRRKCEIEDIIIKVEELEAVRLKDIEKLNQEECAKKMQVSRQTFQNIIDSARKKIATAIVEGKAININGGNYTRNVCNFKCMDCGNVYEIKYEEDRNICPVCGSRQVLCNKKSVFCNKMCNKSFKNGHK
ncbi:DUF134 domain-containing protein [Clostridium tyrobutyricum]|jgi:predicted DNA-binding protein (UPF0251 family)/DNA-directed RNA polymerase subunit RPC12/RpoP|uniref:UPF0251 protein CTDIVETGP_2174 n=1 Tax=Clostridium tyrobutyricum DIVETGP TaxID=1408889 RepID=W6N9B1_CLOTY|nr:DUF134 domain-containing protein [Clostridium tyrobutyricum]AND83668.1 hypothetical protein CTK_C03980 [Clostridium tyrobutyricum]ANP68436.1 hypothetical protein BA182_01740 [Clostridium tyrobutyricum]MBR9648887.1 DUF134 domain-containing protein [Clostridium tyrobutyricum]MBV4416761.1 DUF134 domain-containing protein [Clostridium tyrobutyricum]MBV4425439.1 DUF134 domain-containing protein [Clostridium tyrobutyricum]